MKSDVSVSLWSSRAGEARSTHYRLSGFIARIGRSNVWDGVVSVVINRPWGCFARPSAPSAGLVATSYTTKRKTAKGP